MSKRVAEIDWESYASTYPDRYLLGSPFDQILASAVDSIQEADVLDIGGGVEGTHVLRRQGLRCFLLDPNVGVAPSWARGRIDWESARRLQFDLVVARNCFGYLEPEEIRAIPSMLRPGGRFLANTFYRCRDGERPYRNTRSGTSGIERVRCIPERSLVCHELEPAEQDYVIRHFFFLRSLDQIIALLGTEGLTLEFYGRNSLCVRLSAPAHNAGTPAPKLAKGDIDD